MVGGVKGTAIESVVADVNRLVDAGVVSRADLEVRLEAEDLESVPVYDDEEQSA